MPTAQAVIGGQPLVQPSGKVIMPIQQASKIVSFASTNGGTSYTGPTTIATLSYHTVAGNFRGAPTISAGIDSTGKVYAAWQDCRFIANCTANDIVYSSSADGTTWSAVTRIPIDATTSGVDHFLPGLAVDPNDLWDDDEARTHLPLLPDQQLHGEHLPARRRLRALQQRGLDVDCENAGGRANDDEPASGDVAGIHDRRLHLDGVRHDQRRRLADVVLRVRRWRSRARRARLATTSRARSGPSSTRSHPDTLSA